MPQIAESNQSSNKGLQDISPEERQTRIDLAAAYRLVALFKWDDLIYTHITARIPGTHHLLINPYGLMFEEVSASNLVKIDLEGNILQDSKYAINPAGFLIHSAVHKARPEVQCVVHTHTLNGIAVSAQNAGVLPISQHSIFVLSSIGYHKYEGVALRDEERPRLVDSLGDKTFLMLRNHGLLTTGPTIADAFQSMYFFEAACTIQVRAQAGGTIANGDLSVVDPETIRTATEQQKTVTRGAMGSLVWPGLLRRLDRMDRSYRD